MSGASADLSKVIRDEREMTTTGPATEFATVEQLGAIVAARRRELGITQADLALRCGVSRQWVVRFERGTNSVETGLALRTLRSLKLHLKLAPPVARAPG